MALTSLRALQGAAGVAAGGGAATFTAGSFTANTATGTQAVTGVGFTPTAIVFFSAGSEAASGTWSPDIWSTIGFTSGASESFAVGGSSDDGAATSTTARRIASKCIVFADQAGSAADGEADLTSFDVDGFTVDWTNAPGAAYEVQFLAFGGVSAKALSSTSPTSTGTKAVTGAGFTPDLVLHAGDLATAIPASQAAFPVNFGAMDSAGSQWSQFVTSLDGVGTSDTYRYQSASNAVSAGTTSVAEQAAFSSMDSDGFTLNWTTANATAFQYIHLCLSGLSADCGSFNKSTGGAPASQAVTGVGFQPEGLLLASVANATSASVLSNNARAVGAADGTNEVAALHVDVDAVTTMDAQSVWKNDKVLVLQDTATGSVDAEADLTSFDSDGFTLNWTTNDAVADEILYLAVAAT